MTMVLAICTAEGVVFAADSLAREQAGPRTAAKIWELPGGYGVVTYGPGPAGVPDAVSSFSATGPTTEATARALASSLARLPRAGHWGFYLGGRDGSVFSVVQGEFPGGTTRVLNRPSPDTMILNWWSGGFDPSRLPLWRGNDFLQLPAGEVANYALALLENAGRLDSENVGPPYRALIVRAGGVNWVRPQGATSTP